MLKKLIVAAQLSLSLQASAQAPNQGAALVLPDNFIRVTIGDNEPAPVDTHSRNYRRPKPEDDVRQLRGRVRTLESAVRQLQEEIYYLRYAQRDQRDVAPQVVVQEKSNRWFCSLTSNFNRTYSGRGDTEIEASTRALNACQDKEGGTFCSDKKVRCEEAR